MRVLHFPGAAAAGFRPLLAALLITTSAQAQVATGYIFSSSSGSFSAITGGTLLWGDGLGLTNFDDEVSGAQTIPAFNFNGTVYTQLFVSANGFITFGSAPAGGNFTPLSSAAAYAGAIAPFGANIRSRSSILVSKDVRVQTVGSEVVIQWRGVRRFNAGSEFFDAQARLNTSNGVVRFVYSGPSNLNAVTSEQPEVGLRGLNNTFATNVNNRLVGVGAENWATSLAGTANNSTVRFTSAAPSKSFTSGLTYTFTPNCTAPAATTTVIPNCATSSYTVQVTVTSLGSAATVDLSSTVGGVFANDVGLGTYTTAPLAMGTAQSITVVNNSNSICNLSLGSFNSSCTSPTATTSIATNCVAGNYTVQVNVTGLGSAPNVDLVSSVGGLFADNVGLGSYTTPPVPIGTPVSITMVHNCSTICNVNLGPFNSTCTSPTATTSVTTNCLAGNFTVQVNVTGLGSAPNVDLVSSVGGLFADNVGVGSYTSPPVPVGTPVSITLVHNCNSACNVNLGPFNATGNCVGNGTCLTPLLSIPTNGCPGTNLNVSIPITFPGTALGVDVLLESVDLIVAADLVNNSNFEIRLITPGGQSRNMVINRFGNGTNIGNPATCPTTFLRLIDGGTPLTNTTINNATGNYAPEQALSGFTGDPNGVWTLRVCDEGAILSGDLKFVRLNFVIRGSSDPCAPRTIDCGQARTPNSTAGYPMSLPATACAFNGTASSAGVHWWSYTAATSGEALISLCGTASFNSRVSVFSPVPSCSNPTCLAMSDDAPGCPGSSSDVRFLVTAGQTYLIAVHGTGPAVGTYTISLFCQSACTPAVTNDLCPVAMPITSALADGSASQLNQDNSCAHVDDPTPLSGAAPVVGMWYTFNAGTHARHRLRLVTHAGNPAYSATIMGYALYSGACTGLGASGLLATAGSASTLTDLPLLTPGNDYRLLVYNNGSVSQNGSFAILVDHPGTNDAGVTAVSAPTGVVCGTTVSPVAALKNFGEADLTSVILRVTIDGGTSILDQPWTGTLAFGASTSVNLPAVTTPLGLHSLEVTAVSPNGQPDEIAANDVSQANYDASGQLAKVVIHTDGAGGDLTWTIFDPFFFPVVSGGPYGNNTTYTSTHCLATTFGQCYSFFLYDSAGDGLCCGNGNGSWEIRDSFDRVLLSDQFNGTVDGSQSPAVSTASPQYFGHEFCLPAGPSNILANECGLFNNTLLNKVYCSAVPGVLSYQFEFSDPDVGFLRRIALPRPWVRFSEMFTVPLQPGVHYFARVRVDQGANGFADDHYGGGCEMGIDPAAVPGCTQLIDDPSLPTHSCGVTREFGGSDKIWAQPVVNGSLYKFQFTNAGEGYNRVIQSNNYVCVLNWVTQPLVNGSTYMVRVNVLVSGQWSGFCEPACAVTISNPPVNGADEDRALRTDADAGVFELYPNPVHDGRVTLMLTGLADEVNDVSLDIFTLDGRRVMSQRFSVTGDVLNRVVQLDGSMGTGIYLVNVNVGGKAFVRRLSLL